VMAAMPVISVQYYILQGEVGNANQSMSLPRPMTGEGCESNVARPW
jgi:hypothetical protein